MCESLPMHTTRDIAHRLGAVWRHLNGNTQNVILTTHTHTHTQSHKKDDIYPTHFSTKNCYSVFNFYI